VSTTPLVLAIEPDLRQAAIVKRIVREKVGADVAVVDSRDAAIEAMRTAVPDVLLVSALLSPRDEDDLIAHLRTLENAGHLQTHTIPQLASALGPGEGRSGRGLLSAFRRKKDPEHAATGCDPDLFASEIRTFLQSAADKKRELAHSPTVPLTIPAPAAAAPAAETAPVPEPVSSWASPFEWRPTSDRSSKAPDRGAPPEPAVAAPAPEPFVAEPYVAEPYVAPEPIVDAPMAELPEAVIEPVVVAEAFHEDEPVLAAGPVHEAAPIFASAPIRDPEPIREPEPILHAEPIRDAAPIRAERFAIRDRRMGIQDQGFVMRKLGPLASWARAEGRSAETAQPTGELRSLLSGLAVPGSVAGVRYAAGCRIRRVRVAPSRDEDATGKSKGAVILSKRILAELRDNREHA